MASSRRRFSCSALNSVSVAGFCLRVWWMAHSGLAQMVRNSPFSVPSVTMASVVYLHVLYSGQSRYFSFVGFSVRISTYLLRGRAALSLVAVP